MLRPSLRISLATTLVIVAVLGSGAGMAMRWRNEWKRTEPHRYVEELLQRLPAESLMTQDATLSLLARAIAESPDFNAQERQSLGRRIAAEHKKVQAEVERQNERQWEYRRSCYERSSER
jgi:hypothetical protein